MREILEEFQFRSDEFLKRINYPGKVTVSIDSLKALHKAQIKSIPFENFDICLRREIKLDSVSIFNKLVNHRRGGYCFELNGLLLMALQYFGFDTRALLGRVHISGTPTGRGHQISLVTLENQHWIVDVGFGSDSPQEPLPLILDTEFTIEGKCMRFIKDDLFGVMFQTKKANIWCNLYSFDLNHVCKGDIKHGNHFTSTNPDSVFVFARVAALPIEKGLITLFNYTLKKIIGDDVVISELEPGQAYIDALRDDFGIELDEFYENLKGVADKADD